MKGMRIGYLCATIILLAMGYGLPVQADDLRGVFVGGSFGRARNDYDTNAVDDQYRTLATSAGDTLTFTSSPVNRNANAWWVDAGDMVWPYVGIDAAFFHLGELTHRASGTLHSTAANEAIITTATVR